MQFESKVDKLDVDKLAFVLTNLSKLCDVVENEMMLKQKRCI